MEIQKTSKLFCDSTNVRSFDEAFTLTLRSGEEETAYAFTPQHMKRLLQCVRYHVIQYEKEHGGIETEWSPFVQSPIRPQDVMGTDDD